MQRTSPATALVHSCRFCGSPLTRSFVDLGQTPLCQRHVTPDRLHLPEQILPLHAYVCDACKLVQLPPHVDPSTIFDDYAFFSGFSDTWKRHVDDYASKCMAELDLGASSLVVEVASNDGTLLKAFSTRGIPVTGIEPAENVAEYARDAGVPTECFFLGRATARDFAARNGKADLVAANNVLAHVPQLNDFVTGLAELLADAGVLTVEFPHLRNLLAYNQFDTIYHEHWSYFWVTTAQAVFERHGLRVFRVEQVAVHGGSARVWCTKDTPHNRRLRPTESSVGDELRLDREAGFDDPATYDAFARRVADVRDRLVRFLDDAKAGGRRVVGYGAPGKGNTLLNYCGITPDLLAFTVDRNPKKQGNYLPGSRIPIRPPAAIEQERPDYVLILPWNLRDEIVGQLACIRRWGGRFVVPIPSVEIL